LKSDICIEMQLKNDIWTGFLYIFLVFWGGFLRLFVCFDLFSPKWSLHYKCFCLIFYTPEEQCKKTSRVRGRNNGWNLNSEKSLNSFGLHFWRKKKPGGEKEHQALRYMPVIPVFRRLRLENEE
jgi:hypothetical protein